MTHRYFASPGSEITDEDATILGSSFQRLQDEHGSVTPSMVVDDARPNDSPTHGYFEWDDEVAAEAWRERQATRYIRTIYVVPAHLSEPVRLDKVARVEEVGLSDARYIVPSEASVLGAAQRDLMRWYIQYRQYDDLAHLAETVREALEAIAAMAA